MKDLLSKLSAYHLFNYLLPGTMFVILASKVTHYSLIQSDIVIGLFLYYFVGLVVSRFGSLVIEPVLKWTSLLKFADYKDFVAASKVDEKIDLLSEVNNTYRTFCSAFFLLILLKIYEIVESRYPILKDLNPMLFIILMLIMFLISYRKQTNYITRRIRANM